MAQARRVFLGITIILSVFTFCLVPIHESLGQPSWPSNYVTIIVDAVEPETDGARDLVAIQFYKDSTYAYFRIVVRDGTGKPARLQDNRYFVYIDTNGDSVNDYLIQNTGPNKVEVKFWDTTPEPDQWSYLTEYSSGYSRDGVSNYYVELAVRLSDIGNPEEITITSASSKPGEGIHDPTANTPAEDEGINDTFSSSSEGIYILSVEPIAISLGSPAYATATAFNSTVATVDFFWTFPGVNRTNLGVSMSGDPRQASDSYTPIKTGTTTIQWTITAKFYDSNGTLVKTLQKPLLVFSNWVLLGTDPTGDASPPAVDDTALHFTNNGTILCFRMTEAAAPNIISYEYRVYLDTKSGGQISSETGSTYAYDYYISSSGYYYEWKSSSWEKQGSITFEPVGKSVDGSAVLMWTDLTNFNITQNDINIWAQSRYVGGAKIDDKGAYTISKEVIPELPWPTPLIFVPAVAATVYYISKRRFKKID